MNINQDFERIESYLFDRMSPEERAEFEKELSTNVALRNAIEEHRQDHEAMELMVEDDLRSQMNEWEKERVDPGVRRPGIQRNLFIRIAIAAAFILTIGYFARDFLLPGAQTIDVVAYLDENIGPENTRGVASAPEALRPAVELINQGEYDEALNALPEQVDSAILGKRNLLEAKCLLQLGRWEEASVFLEEVVRAGTGADSDEASFYLLLSYIQMEEEDKARDLLEELYLDKGHPYSKEVEELYQKGI